MKKNILLLLLLPGMLLGGTGVYAKTSDSELKTLEVQVERVGSTILPDFAPQSFKSMKSKLRELRAIYEKEGRVPPQLLAEVQQELERFRSDADRGQQVMKKAYPWRNAAVRFNFVRSFDPVSLYRAEQTYNQALKLVSEHKFDEARRVASDAKRQYKTLIRNAHSNAKKMLAGVLKTYKKGVKSDISALKSSSSSIRGLGRADGAIQRIRPLDVPTGGFNGVAPPYIPPDLPPDGPQPPVNIWVSERTPTSLKISWTDVSNDEDGNRLMRSDNFINWPTILNQGPIPRMTTFSFVDTNLTSDKQYCYVVESFNAFGARRSNQFCTYTLNAASIPVWRLELRVKVADFADAGLGDEPLRVYVGGNVERSPVLTVLDYGRDDFERAEFFTYDLNLGHIKDLNDITNLILSNRSTDALYIEEFSFRVNQREVFSRHFGATADSALRIADSYSYAVEFAELRNDPDWQLFVNTSKEFPGFDLLPLIDTLPDGRKQIVIPADQIVSRTESLVGHMLNVDQDIRDRFRWGFITGPAVEVSKANDKALHFDLDLEAKINNWPNPAVDLDFDIEVASRCDSARHKLNVDLTSKNFTTSTDFSLWKDLLSLGMLPLSDKLIEWYANECATPPEIKQSFEVNLPQNFNCNDINIKVNDDAGITVCCFAPQP
jgi:hypothetical protein